MYLLNLIELAVVVEARVATAASRGSMAIIAIGRVSKVVAAQAAGSMSSHNYQLGLLRSRRRFSSRLLSITVTVSLNVL